MANGESPQRHGFLCSFCGHWFVTIQAHDEHECVNPARSGNAPMWWHKKNCAACWGCGKLGYNEICKKCGGSGEWSAP